MEPLNFNLMAMVAGSTFLIALCILGLLTWVEQRRVRSASLFLDHAKHQVVFLFDDERLVNATSEARQVIASAPKVGSDWTRFLTIFLPRFPDIKARIAALADEEVQRFESGDGSTVLMAEWAAGLARLTLYDVEQHGNVGAIDKHSLAALERELETLRAVASHMPVPAWRELADGTITWANRAYLEMADRHFPQTLVPAWPPRRLFEQHALGHEDGPQGQRRVSVVPAASAGAALLPGHKPGAVQWFDCHRASLGPEALFTAIPATAVVKAEEELHEFIQTLSRTFAHVPIGLAVFDRARKLALFNPAIADLTQLPVAFLAGRPTLAGFLDRLRDAQMMPEPKDYANWRNSVAAIEAAAVDGTFQETWHIPTGQIYRVTGRPHPGGGVAFLFEDISAEITMNRRYRTELETGQAILDSMDEAIAVFAANGTLMMTNNAYDLLFGAGGDDGLTDITILDATRSWYAMCAPSPLWGEARDFVAALGERAEWTGEARMWDGRRLACRFTPLNRGVTLVGFTVSHTAIGTLTPGLTNGVAEAGS